jgi:hypothetical protein
MMIAPIRRGEKRESPRRLMIEKGRSSGYNSVKA